MGNCLLQAWPDRAQSAQAVGQLVKACERLQASHKQVWIYIALLEPLNSA
eukprot:CAMPEP_0172701478 /NCGR_PEP_ID=MMETSP1074-20121228/31668_1 /TAXON_ID=2916 /ORGANISM="Ceratium fusus, Strain PA161109" /LENGTH=49 /DNA_ID=CAMNT_0013523033 /DNA_START=628 /DNA_END=777 /DNA_ORIENTATION=-